MQAKEYKETAIKIVKGLPVKEDELNNFIAEYIQAEKGININVNHLVGIRQAIAMGAFSLYFAAKRTLDKMNIQITSVVELSTGKILRVDVE